MLWNNARVLRSTTTYLIKQKYSAAFIGLLWTILFPILFLGLYALVFTHILQVKISGHSSFEYTLLIFAGLIPFLGFSEALGAGVTSVVDNKALVKNAIFPLELVAVQSVLTTSVTMVVGLLMLMAILVARGQLFVSQLIIPIALLLQLIFTIGIIWLLSILNVFFRDLSNLVSPLILFLMLVSPIGYTIEMIPPELMPLMYPNPLFYMILIYRESMFLGVVPWGFLSIFAFIAFTTFFLGYFLFWRLKGLCADYV
jgi:lipopolysaccharide transport system permease protein